MQPDRPVQTTLAFHASRIVIDVGVLIAMASMSLPFVEAEAGNRSALQADAFPALLLLLPIFAVTLIPDHTRPLHPIVGWTSLMLGFAALPYAFVKMLDAGILADTLDGSVGLGARLLLLGCVVTLVGIGIGLYRSVRGLPAGGTPGRSAVYRTGGKAKTDAAGPDPKEPRRRKTREKPKRGDDQRPTVAAEASPAPTRIAPAAPPGQPEIVFPDTGAVAREAEPDLGDDMLDTAERADAALDDHLMSMFGPPDADGDDTPEP